MWRKFASGGADFSGEVIRKDIRKKRRNIFAENGVEVLKRAVYK